MGFIGTTAQGIENGFKGLKNAILHPLDTAAAVGNAVTHPLDTATAVKDAASDGYYKTSLDWMMGDSFGATLRISETAGEALTSTAVTAGVGTVASTAVKGVVVATKTASVANKLDDAADVAKTAGKTDGGVSTSTTHAGKFANEASGGSGSFGGAGTTTAKTATPTVTATTTPTPKTQSPKTPTPAVTPATPALTTTTLTPKTPVVSDFEVALKSKAKTFDEAFGGSSGVAGSIIVNPNDIRFSQTSINGANDLISSMKLNGWKGESIDVVKMPDGVFTTIDNTRVFAAREAGIDVKANIHPFDDILPEDFVKRFTTKKGIPFTWGDAIKLRIQKQNLNFRSNYPFGSFDMLNPK